MGTIEMISDFLSSVYPWTKSLHIISVIAWMAGLFYLPRLFVYHVETVVAGSETDKLFQLMEKRLFSVIMRPAMISSWFFGLCLVLTPGIVDWGAFWPWTKAAAVLAMTGFHEWLGARRGDFISGEGKISGRQYRMMNEVPTLLLIIIVVSVVVRPF